MIRKHSLTQSTHFVQLALTGYNDDTEALFRRGYIRDFTSDRTGSVI